MTFMHFICYIGSANHAKSAHMQAFACVNKDAYTHTIAHLHICIHIYIHTYMH